MDPGRRDDDAGQCAGLLQDNSSGLLAYSSVAHAGYMLIGLAVAPYLARRPDAMVDGVEAVFFYLVAYGAMTSASSPSLPT